MQDRTRFFGNLQCEICNLQFFVLALATLRRFVISPPFASQGVLTGVAMNDKRVIIGHAPNEARGPHFELPASFVPLRLRLESERVTIEVACPNAIVGRHSDADFRLAYPDVSRQHCRLAFEDGQWRLHDLQSLNGTFVNNIPAIDTTLYAGDCIRIGNIQLLVLSATPLLLADTKEDGKLRQIEEVLPER